MKKTAILLFALVLIMSMFAGCRRKQNGEPSDPTVNNSSETMPMTTVGTEETTRNTRPIKEPTTHSTVPDDSETYTTEGGADGESTVPGNSTVDGSGRNRNRIMDGR